MNSIKKIYCRVFQRAFRAALPVLPYREPYILYNADAVAERLQKKNICRILLVSDKGIVGAGLTNGLTQALAAHGIAWTLYDGTVPNPTIDNVEQAREMYLKNNCQALVALGGGSVIDCAKVTAARIACPKKPVAKMRGLLRICRRLPLLIAAPTTAGTGSETTLAAVITDARTHHKYPINDFSLIPPFALLDWRLTEGLPPHLTATTGMDALTHAVEAYIGGSTDRYTRAMAEEAVCLIRAHLRDAVRDGHNETARRCMIRAAFCAGNAFTRAYVGYVHAIAHSLGGQYGVPHGLANAVILPWVLESYGSACHKRLACLARTCGIAPKAASDAGAAQEFIRWVRDMNRAFGIPEHLDCIREADIPAMARHADAEANPLYPVPKLMDAAELAVLYHKVSGKEEELDDVCQKRA